MHTGVDLVEVDQVAGAVSTTAVVEELVVDAVARPNAAEDHQVPMDRRRDLVSISLLRNQQMAMLLKRPSTFSRNFIFVEI